jgi:hypothetical protein
MARQRVRVEDATPAAQLRAVASPVETYVRPVEEPNIRSDLEYFIGAITPAVQAAAEVRKEQALKLQREAEKGIASKRSADLKLGMAKAQRLAAEDFLDNEDEYYNLSEEEIVDRRARIMQPYYEMAEASGDQLLIDAFKADNEIASLTFFTKVYDPAKRKRVFLDDMDALGEELLAISTSGSVLNDPDTIASPKDETLAKIGMIEDTFNKYQAASNYSFRDMNDYVFKNIIAPRVAANGRDALYRWAEEKKLFNVSRYQSTLKTMNNELAARDKALLKQQDPAAFQQSIVAGIDSFYTAMAEGRSANVGYLQIGNTVTLPSGATKTITETDVINSFEFYANSEQLSPALRLDFYKRTGFIPTNEKNIINSGRSFFTSGDLENEADLMQAAAAFAAMEQMRMAGIDIPASVADKETMKRFKVVELWHRDAGMNIKDAFARAQNLNTDIKPSNKLKANITNKIGTMWGTDHGDTVNSFNNIQAIAEDVELIMQSGISDETVALKKAIEIFEKDHVIHTASNGVKISFKQLNTDVGTATDVTSTLDVTAKAIGDNQQIKNIIAQQYPIAENPGVVITNVDERPDIVRISVMDENGIFMGQLATVSKTQLLNDPQLVNNIIAQNIQSAINSGINPNATAETTSIAEIKSSWYGMPTARTNFVGRTASDDMAPPTENKATWYSMPPTQTKLTDTLKGLNPLADETSTNEEAAPNKPKLDIPTDGKVEVQKNSMLGDIGGFVTSIIGALVDAGIPEAQAKAAIESVPLPPVRPEEAGGIAPPSASQRRIDAALKRQQAKAEEYEEMNSTPLTIVPAMGRAVIGDILRNQLGIDQSDITRTENYFSPEELSVVRKLVEKGLKGNKKKGYVSYKDYTTKSEDVAFATDVLPEKLIDAEYSIKTTLGQFNWKIDNRGHLIVTDKYDFNDAKDLQEANPDFDQKVANLKEYAARPDIGTYGIMRRAAALFGSKEGQGVNFEIDLGPAKNIPLPPRRKRR